VCLNHVSLFEDRGLVQIYKIILIGLFAGANCVYNTLKSLSYNEGLTMLNLP